MVKNGISSLAIPALQQFQRTFSGYCVPSGSLDLCKAIIRLRKQRTSHVWEIKQSWFTCSWTTIFSLLFCTLIRRLPFLSSHASIAIVINCDGRNLLASIACKSSSFFPVYQKTYETIWKVESSNLERLIVVQHGLLYFSSLNYKLHLLLLQKLQLQIFKVC